MPLRADATVTACTSEGSTPACSLGPSNTDGDYAQSAAAQGSDRLIRHNRGSGEPVFYSP